MKISPALAREIFLGTLNDIFYCKIIGTFTFSPIGLSKK